MRSRISKMHYLGLFTVSDKKEKRAEKEKKD
jgi:hypothetical protein